MLKLLTFERSLQALAAKRFDIKHSIQHALFDILESLFVYKCLCVCLRVCVCVCVCML